jgi:hypothetical protein
MKPTLVVLLAAVLPFVAACSKSNAKKGPAKTDSPASAEATPRRNAAESLGFAAEGVDGYMQPEAPRPADTPIAPSQAAPDAAAPAAASSDVSKPGIRRTLTATDGRTVEAELLAKSEQEVRFRRAADAREFTIPLARISEADRDFVRESELPPLAAR